MAVTPNSRGVQFFEPDPARDQFAVDYDAPFIDSMPPAGGQSSGGQAIEVSIPGPNLAFQEPPKPGSGFGEPSEQTWVLPTHEGTPLMYMRDLINLDGMLREAEWALKNGAAVSAERLAKLQEMRVYVDRQRFGFEQNAFYAADYDLLRRAKEEEQRVEREKLAAEAEAAHVAQLPPSPEEQRARELADLLARADAATAEWDKLHLREHSQVIAIEALDAQEQTQPSPVFDTTRHSGI